MFRNREDGARQLAARLRSIAFRNPLVLAIPSGGVTTGATVAQALGMPLDVLLCRKLRRPDLPDPIGCVSESGSLSINREAQGIQTLTAETLVESRTIELAEIARQRAVYRQIRPPATIAHRSILLADDGVVTGCTMRAALDGIRRSAVFELVVICPVVPQGRLAALRGKCDRLFCVSELESPRDLAECYEEFPRVSEEEATRLFCESKCS